jgi:hypothetical protein
MTAIAVLGARSWGTTLARPPVHRDGWVYEEKYDGWRMLAYRDGSRVRLSHAGRQYRIEVKRLASSKHDELHTFHRSSVVEHPRVAIAGEA